MTSCSVESVNPTSLRRRRRGRRDGKPVEKFSDTQQRVHQRSSEVNAVVRGLGRCSSTVVSAVKLARYCQMFKYNQRGLFNIIHNYRHDL